MMATMPTIQWLLYSDNGLAPYGRRLTLVAHKELADRLDQIESRIKRKLEAQDDVILDVLATIRQLMAPPEPKRKRPIGFVTTDEK